jgi:hypothetical protein
LKRRASTVVVTGGTCFGCGEPATAARSFAVGKSRYDGKVCDDCRAKFDYTWQTWRRLAQSRGGQLRLQCAMCVRAFAGRRWFEVDNAERVVSLCKPHIELFDTDVAAWVPKFADVELDAVLTPAGKDHVEAAQEVYDRGRDGRDSAEQIRAMAARHRRSVPPSRKPVYVKLPARWGVDTGDWHFTDEAIRQVGARGLALESVLLAACRPHATARRYESGAGDSKLMVFTRGEGVDIVHAVVEPTTCVILDAYGPGIWAWVTDKERVTG